MGRLTYRSSTGRAFINHTYFNWEDGVANKLAHYEDMEELGRLIEVIRCKDCRNERYCEEAQYLGEDGYCSKAELKELEGDKE